MSAPLQPLPAAAALEAFYLDARSRVLDLAAALDRIDRGGDPQAVAGDVRLKKLRAGIELLLSAGPDRAEAVQRVFSQEYDPGWPRPTPR
jgi:hypothetical protein